MDEFRARRSSKQEEETRHETDTIEKHTGSISKDGSDTAKGPGIEDFSSYKLKIKQLLTSLGLTDYAIDVIQHGSTYENCVYRLTRIPMPEQRDASVTEQKYILRVPNCPFFERDDGICQALVSDVALMMYLSTRLPLQLPRTKAYSAATNNILKAPFTIETQIADNSMKDIYAGLDLDEKLRIVDQFVDLLVNLENTRFASAGTFAVSSPLPLSSSDFLPAAQDSPAPRIRYFNKGDERFVKDLKAVNHRRGPDLKTLLSSHINGWIQRDLRIDPENVVTVHHFPRMLTMLETLEQEGAFAETPCPIVLHHNDLEPRNIMVKKSSPSGEWKITGLIDWDEAIAVPRALARRPPTWIWDFDVKNYKGYINVDHYPYSDEELSEEGKSLKKHFETRAKEEWGEQYLEDAYGHGRWLRRIWDFVRSDVHRKFYLGRIEQLGVDWDERVGTGQTPSATATKVVESGLE